MCTYSIAAAGARAVFKGASKAVAVAHNKAGRKRFPPLSVTYLIASTSSGAISRCSGRSLSK